MVALSILPLRQRIGRVVARSTRATTVTSSPSTRLDRSVSLPGSKYRRGTKSSRSPTVWRLRYFARGLAVGLPTTWPSGVDRSATSLHPQQQRMGRLTTVDEADLDVVATLSRRGGDHGRELRRSAGALVRGRRLGARGWPRRRGQLHRRWSTDPCAAAGGGVTWQICPRRWARLSASPRPALWRSTATSTPSVTCSTSFPVGTSSPASSLTCPAWSRART